jgi:hypothetical protein
MIMKLKYVMPSVIASLFLFNNQMLMAAQCQAESSAHIVPLLELYTSEGCSSCPPADQWLSHLPTDYSKFTPLAFHVDYWDYIGWKDRFSKAAYSERQRKIAAFSGAGFVYTPQFVMNGRDFKGSDRTRLNRFVDKSQQFASRANLKLEAQTNEQGEIVLQANAKAEKSIDYKKTDVFVAIYENKLVSQIKAGENNGRELKHDYVVREFFGAYQLNNLNVFEKTFTLNANWHKRDAGAVIFVQDATNGEVLQSLALPFCGA